jgi:hypothetical protein
MARLTLRSERTGPPTARHRSPRYAARVIIVVDERLREEASRFKLVFACPSCAWLDEAGACALGYPNADHLDARLDESRREVIFCKAFEVA